MGTPFGSGLVVISRNEAVTRALPTTPPAHSPHPSSAHSLKKKKMFVLNYVLGSCVTLNNCDHTNVSLPDTKCDLSLLCNLNTLLVLFSLLFCVRMRVQGEYCNATDSKHSCIQEQYK